MTLTKSILNKILDKIRKKEYSTAIEGYDLIQAVKRKILEDIEKELNEKD